MSEHDLLVAYGIYLENQGMLVPPMANRDFRTLDDLACDFLAPKPSLAGDFLW